jgi:SnoaL-like domain
MRQRRSVLIVLAVMTFAGCASRPDPAALVKRYIELHRSGDIEGLLSLHTADSEFLIPGQDPIRGTEALRDLFQWDHVLESELVMTGIRSVGDTIIIDSTIERNQWFRGLGLVEVHYGPGTRIVLKDGRIAGTYPAGFDDQTQQHLMERFQMLVQWISEHRADALDQLLPGQKFRYDAETAEHWLEILAEWNNAQQSDG